MTSAAPSPAPPRGLTETLLSVTGGSEDPPPERLSLGEIVNRLGLQARAMLILIFAIPNCLPGIPGTSAVTGLPLVFLTLQMALARPAWLPGFLARRTVSRVGLAQVLARAAPWLLRVERWLRPRLDPLVQPTAERLVGALGIILSVLIMLPIPFGNMVPALSLIAFALAMIARDGIWVLVGLFLSGVAVAVLVAAGWAAFLALAAASAAWIGL